MGLIIDSDVYQVMYKPRLKGQLSALASPWPIVAHLTRPNNDHLHGCTHMLWLNQLLHVALNSHSNASLILSTLCLLSSGSPLLPPYRELLLLFSLFPFFFFYFKNIFFKLIGARLKYIIIIKRLWTNLINRNKC